MNTNEIQVTNQIALKGRQYSSIGQRPMITRVFNAYFTRYEQTADYIYGRN